MDKKNDKNQKVDNVDEIDEFAKALLNKKTEMVLFPEDDDVTSQALDRSQRKAAEESMSSALDMLRKERGQVSIEEEEEAYVYDQNKNLFDEASFEEKGTFESLFESMDQKQEEKDSKSTKGKPEKRLKKEKPEKRHKKEKVEKSKPISTEVAKKKKNVKMMIIGFVLLVLLLLAGYSYKVTVYDPAHIISEQQQESYDKLVAYADEWDMLSDTEKLELIDLEADYDNLVDSQREKINEYFIEQTDYKFSKLLSEMKKLSKEQQDEANPNYRAIIEYMNGWKDKSGAEKRRILNYEASFDELSEYLKGKVNDRCVQEADYTFKTLCKDQKELQNKEIEAKKEQERRERENKRNELESQINELTAQLNELQIYQESLVDDGSEEMKNIIATNQQAITDMQNKIQNLQNQKAALGE